jgi:hypothetical protein
MTLTNAPFLRLTQYSLPDVATNEIPSYYCGNFSHHLPTNRVGLIMADIPNFDRVEKSQNRRRLELHEEYCHWLPVGILAYDLGLSSSGHWWICFDLQNHKPIFFALSPPVAAGAH